jgi:hypothetical protein
MDDNIRVAESHMSDKGYELSTHEKQAEFARKRMENDDYDVVLDTLEKQYHLLWKMTEANMNADAFNIMDQIRLEQMDKIKEAIDLWKNRHGVRK